MTGYGQDEQMVRILRRSSAGGLRRDLFALDLGQDEMAKMENAYSPTEGIVEVRPGFTEVASGITFGPVLAMSGYRDDSNNQFLMVVAAGDGDTLPDNNNNARLYSWNGTDAEFTHEGTLTGFTAWDGAKIQMIQATELVDTTLTNTRTLVISTDQEGVKKYVYDGSSLTLAAWGDSDVNQAYEYAQGRLLAGGNAANIDSIFHSDMHAFTATGFDPTALREFRSGTGTSSSAIVNAKVFRGRDLIIFMDDSVEILNMNNSNIALDGSGLGVAAGGIPLFDWTRGVLHGRIGCGAWNTVASVGEDMFFLDNRLQVRSLASTINDARSGIKSLPMSEPIKDYLETINPAAIKKCVATHFERYYILSVPLGSSTEPDHVFVLDVAQSARKQKPVWYGPWTNMDPVSFAVTAIEGASQPSDETSTLYFANGATLGTEPKVFRAFDGNTDDGEPIPFQVDYPREHSGTLELLKYPRYMRVFCQAAASVTLQIESNCDSVGFEQVGYMDTTGGAPALPQDLPFNLGGEGLVTKQFNLEDIERCRDVQFRMTATATGDLKLLGYAYYAHVDNFETEASDD